MKENNSFVKDLITLTVSRPVAVTMIVIAVTVFGFVSYQRLPVNLMPDISYPTLTIRTEYPGSAPEEVEKNITEKIEESLATISNLVAYNSTSRSEISDVVLEFTWNTNMSVVIQEVREKLDRIVLPDEATRPLILRYDPSLDPIMRIGLYGNASLFELRDISELEIKRALETIAGIASVKIKGGLEEEVRIDLEDAKLSTFSIPISRVVQRIREENLNTPCGSIREGERTYLVRTQNEFKTLSEIRNLPIQNKEGINITLKELGTVQQTHREREIITRIGNNPSVEIEIYKEAGANIITVVDAIKIKLFGPPQAKKIAQQKKEKSKIQQSKNAEKIKEKKDNKKRKKGKKRGRRGGGGKKVNMGSKSSKNSKQLITWITAQLPKGIHLEILSDQSEFIRQAIDEVINTCVTGGILAILILFLFLRQPGSTFIIAITIPICIVATFTPLHLSHTSLNIMSLGGLALGIGMLVDNSIVVLESIVRHRNAGKSARESAIIGTEEVGGAITASTLTTVAVFFPILYIEGIAGQIFQDQALTVVFSLTASLIMAMIVIPVLASRNFNAPAQKTSLWSEYLVFKTTKDVKENWNSNWFKKIYILCKSIIMYPIECVVKLIILSIHLLFICVRFIVLAILFVFKILLWPLTMLAKVFSSTGKVYAKTLYFSIKHPVLIAMVCVSLIASSIFCLFNFVGAELVPELHQGEFSIHVSLTVGSPLSKSNRILQKYEKFLREQPAIKQAFSRVGAEKTSTNDNQEGTHTGVITCLLNTKLIPPLKEDDYLSTLRLKIPMEPEVKSIRFSRPTLFSFKTPVEIEIYGYDLDILKKIGEDAISKMQNINALYDIKISLERGHPELHIRYNREYLFKKNLTLGDVASLVRSKIQGETVGKFRLKEKEIPIVVKLREKDRNHMDSLNNLVVSSTGNRTYLREVSQIEEGSGPSEIRHMQQQRVILITANIYGMDLQKVATQIREKLKQVKWPAGYKFQVGGQSEEQEVATKSMQFALFLAAFLVYAIMASQFESLFQPFLIMFTLPLAFIGVIFALVMTGTPVSIIVLIGIIILCGIVVNNAIVMIDFINQLREQGKSIEDAVIEGAETRLRPILMTTLTTLLGLLPMTGIFGVGGQGVEIRSPLAITVVSGLISSTLLTLIVIPVVYTWGEKLRVAIKTRKTPTNG